MQFVKRILLFGAVAVMFISHTAFAATATKQGVTITIPKKWALNPNRSAEGPLSINNFSSQYVRGGLVPSGGATIDIGRKPLPSGTLDEIVDAERRLTRYFSKSTETVGGSPAIRVTYGAEIWPDYLESDVGVYVARGQYLYFFHLVYNSSDTRGEPGYLSAFNSVLSSVQFGQ